MNSDSHAAIDIGTNSFHLIVGKVKENGYFDIIDREKEIIRLGEGSGGDIKEIKRDAIERAIVTLKRFKGIADSHNATLRAVATSAVREALNRNIFIKKVYDETGIEVEVVNGYEEARLIYLGILRAVPIFNKKTLCVDVGGGSTEFIIGTRGNIDYSLSVKVGHVRMSQKFFPDGVVTKDRIQMCRRWVEGEIYPAVENIKRHKVNNSIGSSGTVMAVGSMILKVEDEGESADTVLNNFEFSSSDLHKITQKVLSKKYYEDRKKIKGLDSKRADTIPAGVIILNTIFEQVGIKKMTISGDALREGILIDTLQKQKPDSQKPKLENIRLDSVKSLAAKSQFDRKHCAHVAKLAVAFFDQLTDVHKLDSISREYLEAAARLHDIGYQISHTQHHRHSEYIIKNSELLGFNDNEINIIAHVARYHRKSHPKLRHKEFSVLPEKSKDIVRKLAALLRVVDSLDRTHSQRITSINVKVKSITVELSLEFTDSKPEIEFWSFDRRKALFEEVFGKRIIIME